MSVLVVVAHPDDETIGAGAMLASLDDVHVVHLTDGAPGDHTEVRAAEARQALLFIINLDDEQCDRKRRMFECLETKRDVLAQFPIEMERFRVAPCYDFSRPPHAGPLWYEILGFSMDGEMWRRVAAESFACVA